MINVSAIDAFNRAYLNSGDLKPNAVIKFSIADLTSTEELQVDAIGNPILTESSENVTLECWLKPNKRPHKEKQIGAGQDYEYFVGRLITPKTYSFPLRSIGDVEVEINGRVGSVVDSFYVKSAADVSFGISKELGQRIAVTVDFGTGQ